MLKYEQLFTFKNLYNAYLKSRKSKRFKKEVINFESNLGSNLSKLQEELLNEKYGLNGLNYHSFMVYEPKERRVDAIEFKDRIVQHCLCDNYLVPLYEKRLIYDNAATRINKGTDFARKRLKYFHYDYFNKKGSNKGYVLKCDIHHFFQSIDQDVLRKMLKKDIKDNKILKLINLIIDSFELEKSKGLPIGNQTSQLFGIRYLDKIDRLIKEKFRIKYYIRYMDDFLLIHESKEYLNMIYKEIKKILLDEFKLELNKKTRIYKLSDSVEFLGFNYRLLNNKKIVMKTCGKKRKNFSNKINCKIKSYSKGKINKEKLFSTFNSYINHLSKGNNYLFKVKIIKLKEDIASKA